MEVPDWDDYNQLSQKTQKLEKALYCLAELTGVAKYSFMGNRFDTRAEAEVAEKEYFEQQIRLAESNKPQETGFFCYPKIQIELPEL